MADNKDNFHYKSVSKTNETSLKNDINGFDFSVTKTSNKGFKLPPKRIQTADASGYSWTAVSVEEAKDKVDAKFFHIPDAVKQSETLEFSGKDLQEGKYSKENLENANFSAANLTRVDFSGSNLKGADLSGANLTEANLENADLTNAVLSGANLLRANFTGANLSGVTLTDANLEDVILLDIEIDDLGIEELQNLIEYLAKYYPHKLNLTNINLTLLDLKRIDLTKVSLRGVDFTGCDMTGVKIWELDLSECIISPAQIAQALGRVPTPQEMAKLLAPKGPKKKKKEGVDFTELFFGNDKEFGVWDVSKDKGLDIGKLVEQGMSLFRRSAPRPPVKESEILSQIKEERASSNQEKAHNEEMKEKLLQRKREEQQKMSAKKSEFENVIQEKKEKAREEIAEKKRVRTDYVISQVRDSRSRA